MGEPNPDMTAGMEHGGEQADRNSPSSSVCYVNPGVDWDSSRQPLEPTNTAEQDQADKKEIEILPLTTAGMQPGDDSDSTPRSEVPSALDPATLEAHNLAQPSEDSEPGYFSPQPMRVYSTKLPTSAPTSTGPSPTASVNASTTSVHASLNNPVDQVRMSELQERPSVQRDISAISTASDATVRAASADPLLSFTSLTRPQRDGPQYPNQSYAALHSQQYPPPYTPHVLRTRSSHPSHHTSLSTAQITSFGLSHEQHRDIMDSGSRTVGNSPASSPGLFSPTTPPLRQTQRTPDDPGYYSSPYLHHTHRQAPKETHIADVDVDPISGRKIINQYEVIDELGRGVHGKVKLGRNLESAEYVAIKIVDRYSKRRRLGKNTSHEDKIKREIAILKKARHENIVSLLEVIDDPTRKKVYIVLEHVELGEVRWRTEGAKEVTLVEWRRFQREIEGISDSTGSLEDDRIIAAAHKRLRHQQQRRVRQLHHRRKNENLNESWSFEHGGESEDDASDAGRSSRASFARPNDQTEKEHGFSDIREEFQDNMNTAIRSPTPTALQRHEELNRGLEGTMYGPYDTELFRGRTPSIAGSSSSQFTDPDDSDVVPEHFHYVPLMTIAAARDAFRDTVLGIEYLHYQGVIHRDIKPANLLLTKEHRIKISDFGVSYVGKSYSTSGDQSESEAQDSDEAIELAKTVGTPAFYAPELCQTDEEAETLPVTGQIDIWALGVTLYCLIYGRVPFHDNNTFALMRMISEDDVYIPHYRLKAAAEKSSSRPNSHGQMYHNIDSSKRDPHNLEYEEVNDILRDLLRRLLIKDPRKRITIPEIKLHPWVTEGLDDRLHWAENTDPRKRHETKISVSKDDMEKAVVPITLIDRMRSGVRKGLDAVFRMGARGGPRRRAQSSTTQDPSQNLSPSSPNTGYDRESRRPSLAMNQSIFDALRLSREPEHPLSQSVTASPEVKEHLKYPEVSHSRPESPTYKAENNDRVDLSRPHPPERAHSMMSTAASVRTVRPSDLPRVAPAPSPILPPALPGTPTALDSPGGTNLGGVFGGYTRKVVNSMRSRDGLRPPMEHGRAKSIDRLVGTDDDGHVAPSLAVSNAFASGHVDLPDALKDTSPIVPPSSWLDHRYPDPTDRASSRQSSLSSASSRQARPHTAHSEMEVGPTTNASTYPFPSAHRETSNDRFSRAKDELIRRRVQEEHQSRERPVSMSFHRPPSSLRECPPSPDDEAFFKQQNMANPPSQQPPRRGSSIDTNSVSYSNSAQSQALTPSSSDDQFGSISQSTSNPSILSVPSATSSMAEEDIFIRSEPSSNTSRSGNAVVQSQTSALQTASHPALQYGSIPDDSAGYDGDHAFDSGDDDDDDSDDGLVMKPKNPRRPTRSESVSVAEVSRQSIRQEVAAFRGRSTRSGSNGTVKKVKHAGDANN